MAFSGAHLHCSIPNQSGVARISTETRTVSAHDLLHSRAAKNVDCNAFDSQFDWFRNIETGEPLTRYVLGRENKSEVVLFKFLLPVLKKLNPDLPQAAYQEASRRVGLMPYQLQAITWRVWRDRHGIK